MECSLDRGPFARCQSPHAYLDLADGPHIFEVRSSQFGLDGELNAWLWTIDAPEDPTVSPLPVPADLVLEATSAAGAVAAYTVEPVDGVTPACTPASGSTFPLGTTIVTCSADVQVGSPGGPLGVARYRGAFTVTVADTTPPSLDLLVDQFVDAYDASGISVYFGTTVVDVFNPDAPCAIAFGSELRCRLSMAVDLVDGLVAVTCPDVPDRQFPIGTTTTTCFAADRHGNLVTDSFRITVWDPAALRIVAPPPVTVDATGPGGAVIPDALLGAPTVINGQAPITITRAPAGNDFPVGETWVVWMANDAAGQMDWKLQLVTVEPFESLDLTSDPNPSQLGQPVTLRAAVSPPTIGGTVTFYDGLTVLGVAQLTNGEATLTTSVLASGGHALKAVVAGIMSATVSHTVVPVESNGLRPAVDYTVGNGPRGIAIGDFDEDGIADVATANLGGSVSVLPGVGDGTFKPRTDYAVDAVQSIVAGDFNRDGNVDLVAGGGDFSTGGAMLLGLGNGAFQMGPAFPYVAKTIAAGDFDADGDMDLALANVAQLSLGGGLHVMMGAGDATFAAAGTYGPAASNPVYGTPSVAAADFNEDGKLDLAAVFSIQSETSSVNVVSIFLGNGDGTFQPGVDHSVGRSPQSVTTGDFDEDGHLDLAVANYDDDSVSVLRGTGQGTFEPAVDHAVGTRPVFVTVGDVNGDNNLDVAVGGSLSVLPGHGGGTFDPAVSYIVGGGRSTVAIGEFNGDGRPDLAVTDRFSNIVSVLLGAAARTTPTLSWANPASIVYGTALDGMQLSATADVAGTFTYSPSAGTVLNAGVGQTLSVEFIPDDVVNYTSASATVTIDVLQATPAISWANPAAMVYGQPLGDAQLSAAASVPGTFTYSPLAGTVLNAGVGQTLSVEFTPIDAVNYASVNATVSIDVAQAPLTVAANPASRGYWDSDPSFTGVVNGVVSGDDITAVFVTTTTTSSPAGIYVDAIVPHIVDPNDRVGNYVVTIAAGTFTISNPLPTLDRLGMNSVVANPNGLVLDVFGSDFVPQSLVRWNGIDLATTFVSRDQLQASVPAGSVSSPGVAYVTVLSASDGGGGGTSGLEEFFVTDSPAPVADAASATTDGPGMVVATTGGDGPYTPGSLTAQATAAGPSTITVAHYQEDPSGVAFDGGGQFFDVFVAPGSSLTALTLVTCTGVSIVQWFDGAMWQLVSDQSFDPLTGCVTIVISSSTSPTLSDLAGTYFTAAGRNRDGRMRGQGHLDVAGVRHHFVFDVVEVHGQERGDFRYWTASSRGRRDLDDDDDDRDNDRRARHGERHRESRFEATAITHVAFGDDGASNPGKRPRTGVDTVLFAGVGSWNGRPGHTFEVRATDRGEGRQSHDAVWVVIRAAGGAVVVSVEGELAGGNVQSARVRP